jgi:CheY-like chemotaxis protein
MENAKEINEVDYLFKKKLLIIDDDKDLIRLMHKALENEFEVSIIDNASDAFDEINQFNPDAILLDLSMPHIDGFEFLNILEQHADYCDIPVVTMTANKDDSYRQRAQREGASGMIYKPFNIRNLARDIKSVLKLTENVLISKNSRITYYIEFSENRKIKKIKDIITSHDFSEAPMVLLSWNRGEDFFEDFELGQELVNENKLYYLEVKPSLISKFPYLQNITPVMLEIQKFLGQNTRDFHIVFEEPRNLLNVYQREKSVFQAYNMAQIIHSEFAKITYVNSRAHNEDASRFLNKIGKILTGVQK